MLTLATIWHSLIWKGDEEYVERTLKDCGFTHHNLQINLQISRQSAWPASGVGYSPFLMNTTEHHSSGNSQWRFASVKLNSRESSLSQMINASNFCDAYWAQNYG